MRPRRPSLLAFLLRTITVPHWFEHRLRSTLTAIGVALGVATVVSVADVSKSVLASFQQMVQTVAGASELEVTAPAGDLDERLVQTVAATPGVAAAAGIVESFIPLVEMPDQTLYLLGVDFLGSRVWETQFPRSAIDIPDELGFIAQLDSLLITDTFARRTKRAHGSEVQLAAPAGTRTLHVRAILGDSPAARLFDGMLVVMDLPAAQRLLGRDGRLDRIAIELTPGARATDVRLRLQDVLGPGVNVEAPEARGERCEQILFSLRSMLATASSLAVIVGAFLVYHTVVVSVHQRRRQFALLNTVGVANGSLLQLCLLEALILAALGTAVGLPGGHILGALASRLVGNTTSEIWIRLDVPPRAHSTVGAGVGMVVGFGTTLIAALLAARATFRTPTVEALRPVTVESETRERAILPMVLACVFFSATWLVALLPSGLRLATIVAVIIATQVLAYLGAALVGPVLIAIAGRATARLARWSPSLPLRLATENLPRTPNRSGTTVSTIAAALGMAVTLAGLVQSFEGAWMTWLEQHFGADLFVGSGARFHLVAGPPMANDVRRAMARIPGVASIEQFRVIPIRLDDRVVFLQGISVDDRLKHGGLAMVEGDLAAAAPSLSAGTGVLLSDNLAAKLRIRRSDTIELPTPAGPRRFVVEGIFVDYVGSLDLGTVAVAYAQLSETWHDHFTNLFRVWLVPGVQASGVRTAILAQLGNGYYAITGREFLEGVRSVLRQFFVATWALQLTAALVGIIGVVNSQLAAVLDRSAEIAMLRTIGVSTRDVARSVLIECAALGALGGVWGAVVGGMLGFQFVTVSLHLVTGWRIPFIVPVGAAIASIVVATFTSAAAGYVPARAAARLQAKQRSLD